MITFRLELYSGERDVHSFDCGKSELTDWLVRHAASSHRADTARTFLAIDDDIVAGYFSITTGSVRPDEAPRKYSRGMPRYPIGVMLIARLAVDTRYQGRGLSSRLLAEAVRLAATAAATAAARLVVVDAIDDRTAAFYRRWGFIDTPEHPMRLYRKMSDIRASLKASELKTSELEAPDEGRPIEKH